MNVRYATAEDLEHWFNGPAPVTMRAIVVEHEGRQIGIAGIAHAVDHVQAFSRVADEMRPHKMTMSRVAVQFREMLKDYGQVWALCSSDEPTAPALLKWCGFVHVREGVWRHG